MEKDKIKSDWEKLQDIGRGAYDSIEEMIERLNHCRNCDGNMDDCEISDADIISGIGYWPKKGQKATPEERDNYHDEEKAQELIQQDPLSVQVRSDWSGCGEELKPGEFEILLSTGGPATRIIGELDEYGEPISAELQAQDWFQPWTTYRGGSESILLDYARQFYFAC